MKIRIAIWATAGALIVVFWSLYFAVTHQNLSGAGGAGWALVCLTCPIALASRHALSIYLVLLANAATYALVGAIVEIARRHYEIRSLSN